MIDIYSYLAGNEERHMSYDRSTPFAPIIATVIGILAWLIFILLFALEWSKSYNLFQDVVIFIVSLAIAAMVISIMWLVWGRNRWAWWTRY